VEEVGFGQGEARSVRPRGVRGGRRGGRGGGPGFGLSRRGRTGDVKFYCQCWGAG
jgi:hypothetical protein